MNEYLSIGEVSKLKNVSIKSLRYYDELGIFKPAYINPQSNYRYYTIDQMIILDVITTCIDLDIPLKTFNKYQLPDGRFQIDKMLEEGQKIANEKIRKLKLTVQTLEHISMQMNYSDHAKHQQPSTIKNYEDRYFLVLVESKINPKIYVEKVTTLYKQCVNQELGYLYNQGLIFMPNKNTIEKMIFVEIKKPKKKVSHLYKIKAGSFNCTVKLKSNIMDEVNMLEKMSQLEGGPIIVQELIDSKLDSENATIEIQQSLS